MKSNNIKNRIGRKQNLQDSSVNYSNFEKNKSFYNERYSNQNDSFNYRSRNERASQYSMNNGNTSSSKIGTNRTTYKTLMTMINVDNISFGYVSL